jgi:hypothetical protein
VATKKKRKKKPAPADGPKNKGGRPKIVIDPRVLAQLATIGCTKEEAAAVIGCGKRTLEIRLREPATREAWDNGVLMGKVSLRRLQWRHASGAGSSAVNMTIHLSKHRLGETDKAAFELSGPGGSPINVVLSKDDSALL